MVEDWRWHEKKELIIVIAPRVVCCLPGDIQLLGYSWDGAHFF